MLVERIRMIPCINIVENSQHNISDTHDSKREGRMRHHGPGLVPRALDLEVVEPVRVDLQSGQAFTRMFSLYLIGNRNAIFSKPCQRDIISCSEKLLAERRTFSGSLNFEQHGIS